jgi:hypothetical protein
MVAFSFLGPGPQPTKPPSRGRLRIRQARQRWIVAALPFAMIIALVVIAVSAEDKCKSPIGRLAVEMKLDYYYSGCKCMKPALDFRDPCNSQYLPLL